MKIFVFGAGASQAAQNQQTYTENHPDRSPLVNELFDVKYQTQIVDGMNFDINECREAAARGSLEQWLTERWNAIGQIKTDQKRKAEKSWFGNINLYVWNVLNRVSQTYPAAQGYTPLLKKLYDNDEEYGLISFNYDTLLDQSYEDVYRNSLSSIENYLSANIIKLHGSVNWFLGARTNDRSFPHSRHQGDMSVRIRAIAENMYNGDPIGLDKVEILDPKHSSLGSIATIMNYYINQGYFYPLLFMPLTGKAYETVYDFNDVIIAKAEELFRSADEVFLVGYSATDNLIHGLLKQVKKGTTLHVIGRNPERVRAIANSTLSMNTNLVEGNVNGIGFVDFVNNY